MILVHLETRGGEIAAQGFELLAVARQLATLRGLSVVAVVLGPLLPDARASLGAADRLIEADHPALVAFTPEAHARALATIAANQGAAVILIAHTSQGMDLGPWLSARLGLALAAPCRSVTAGDEGIEIAAGLYGGRLVLCAAVPWAAILSCSPGAGDEAAGRLPGIPPTEQADVTEALDGLRSAVQSLEAPDSDAVDLTRAERILCVGRGIGSADEMPKFAALAAALGAELAGSRPVVDAGWLPKARQVGKSGARVAPKLYLAFGVSGAPEHLEGMSRADLIVAINTDPLAPIFEAAHLGAVSDVLALVSELTRLARRAPN